jgi:hypothetical protein
MAKNETTTPGDLEVGKLCPARLTSLPFRRGLRKLYHEAAEPRNGRPTADTLLGRIDQETKQITGAPSLNNKV